MKERREFQKWQEVSTPERGADVKESSKGMKW